MKRGITLVAAAAMVLLNVGWTGLAQDTPPAPPAQETPAPEPAPKAKAPKPPKPARPARTVVAPRVFAFAGSGSYLGIDTRDVNAERKQALNLPEERGVEVTLVDKDAPAGKAGLREQDVIVEFNADKVISVEHLKRLIKETPPGRTVTLGIIRGGQPMQVQATLADRAQMAREARVHARARGRDPIIVQVPEIDIEEFEMPDIEIPEIRVIRSATSGLVIENLTAQLGEFFGVSGGQGVLVKSVEKGSPADAAGFRAGDVIVKAGNERVTNRTTWRAALRTQRKAGAFPVVVVRDKREVTLNLKMEEPRGEVKEGMLFDVREVELAAIEAMPLAQQALEMALLEAPELLRASLLPQMEAQRALEMAEIEMEAAEAAAEAAVEAYEEAPRSECPNRL